MIVTLMVDGCMDVWMDELVEDGWLICDGWMMMTLFQLN